MSKLGESIAEAITPTIVEAVVPVAMDKATIAFCESIPLEWLEKTLLKHHDEYGEFDYTECAKELKNRLIKQASKNLFQKGLKP